MCWKLFRLFHWTSLIGRLSISAIPFILLNRYGKKYFEQSEAITMEELKAKIQIIKIYP
jgi:hypothetical protein